MIAYFSAFAGGLLGSAHCVGMCGGFAAMVGAHRRSFGPNLLGQLIYSLGRVFTYAFLGTVGGFAGGRLAEYSTSLMSAQQVLSLIAGFVMLVVGISVLFPGLWRRWAPSRIGLTFVPLFRHFMTGQRSGGLFLAGVANGFLPCGLVYAFLAMGIAQANALDGMLFMACFGMGTIPALTLVGCGSALVSQRTRFHIYRIAACVVIIAGAVTVHRGWPREGNHCCHDATPLAVQASSAVP